MGVSGRRGDGGARQCLDGSEGLDNILFLWTWPSTVIIQMQNERTIALTFVKIFNWDQPKSSNTFLLSFRSPHSEGSIMTKHILGVVAPNEVQLNCCLRISYLPSDNQILIELRQTHVDKEGSELLADFIVNLDFLSKKGVQLQPFGSNKKVLKIVVGDRGFECKNEQLMDRQSRLTEQFIRQKQDYLRRASSSILKRSTNIKKSCSLRVLGLLQEVQQLRSSQKVQNKPQFKGYATGSDYYAGNVNQQKTDAQSRSSSERETPQQSSRCRSQKHRLQIKNLQIVPCESEYYDTPPTMRTHPKNQVQPRSPTKLPFLNRQYR